MERSSTKLAEWHGILGKDVEALIAESRLVADEEFVSLAFGDRDEVGERLRALVASQRGIHDCWLRDGPRDGFVGETELVEWYDVREVHSIDAPTWSSSGNPRGTGRILVGTRPAFSFTPRNAVEAEAAAAFETAIRAHAAFNLGSPSDGSSGGD